MPLLTALAILGAVQDVFDVLLIRLDSLAIDEQARLFFDNIRNFNLIHCQPHDCNVGGAELRFLLVNRKAQGAVC